MKILLTGDCAGGVGTYARTLARALVRRGHRVMLVEFGGSNHRPDLDAGVRRLHLPLALEWQSEQPLARLNAAVRQGRDALQQLAASYQADLLHTNQFSWAGCLPCPTLLGVHSDVVSWWRTVHGQPPPDSAYHRWYRQLVLAALERSNAVVTPTRAAGGDLDLSFGYPDASVIPNGSPNAPSISPRRPAATQARCGAISVGRFWDEGKQMQLLLGAALPLPVVLAGDLGSRPLSPTPNLRHLGPLDPLATRHAMRAALVYVATSQYEPFGLAPLEAAQAGCALLLNDIPSFREVWGSAAFYFRRNDRSDLHVWLAGLAHDRVLVRAGARAARRHSLRYTPERMAAAYEACYDRLLAGLPIPALAALTATAPNHR